VFAVEETKRGSETSRKSGNMIEKPELRKLNSSDPNIKQEFLKDTNSSTDNFVFIP
jgi:hypothetical protein